MKTIATILFLFFVTTTFSQDSVVEYYNEITQKSEYGNMVGPKRWYTDVKIYLDFEDSDSIKSFIEPILNDLNNLIDPINIYFVNDKKNANTFIYFGNFNDYKEKYHVTTNGRFLGLVTTVYDYDKILKNMIFINSKLFGDELKSVLREEITQSLGFMNDSWKYPESIFFQGGYNGCKFSELDKEVIKLHYN